MTPFPAWFDFCRDRSMRRNGATVALYAELIARPYCFSGALDVKLDAFAHLLGYNRKSILYALGELIAHGYLLEHPRDHATAPRRVTVAVVRREHEQREHERPEG